MNLFYLYRSLDSCSVLLYIQRKPQLLINHKPADETASMTQVNSVYLFVKNWNNRWYYPGICLECDNGENVFFSEKTNFFKKRNGHPVFPPQTVTDLSVRPQAEHWDIPDGRWLYAEQVEELYEAEADYHSFAERLKKALEYFHGLPYGHKNILVTQGVKMHNRCMDDDRRARLAEAQAAYVPVRARKARAEMPDFDVLNQLLKQYLNVENPQERLQELLNAAQAADAAQGADAAVQNADADAAVQNAHADADAVVQNAHADAAVHNADAAVQNADADADAYADADADAHEGDLAPAQWDAVPAFA